MKVFVPILSVVLLSLLFPVSAAAEGYTGDIEVRVLLKTDTTSLGQAVEYPDVDNPQVTAIEVVIPPGGETGWHRHPVPGYGYVLSGELTLLTEAGKTFLFGPGSAFAEVVRARHNGVNNGKEPVRLVAFFTGEKGQAFTEKE